MKFTIATILTFLFGFQAFAGVLGYNNTTNLGVFDTIKCSTGLTCSKQGSKLQIIVGPGVSSSAGTPVSFAPYPIDSIPVGTSTAPNSAFVAMTELNVPLNVTLHGLAIENAATVGNNSAIVALFNNSGIPVAWSSLAGTTTVGANAWQKYSFVAPVTVTGPGVYYAGIYYNGTTDRYYTVPSAGAYIGNAGSAGAQVFGTVTSVSAPATFSAGVGPVIYSF